MEEKKLHKAALVLEGGAMRGIFTAGVLDCLMEKDCWFAYVAGVSAGSSNAVDYISRQIGRTRDCMAVRGKEKEKEYINTNLLKFLKSREIFDMEMLYDRYPNELFPFDYDTYFHSPIQCELVLTNCLTGRAEYLDERRDKKRLLSLVAGSSSIPLLSRMVEVDGIPYLDGGLADSIPILRAMEKGYRKIFLVLTREKGYRKKEKSLGHSLIKMYYRKYPELVRTTVNRAKVYNRTMELVEKWEEEGRIFVIRPEIPPVKRTEKDCDQLLAFYQHGYDRMEARMEELWEYLGRKEEKP